MSTHQGGEEYELRIVAKPDDAPAIIRLRRILKALLRTYNFRCTSCRDVTPYPVGKPAEDSPTIDTKEHLQCIQP